MSKFELVMPKLGESIQEATITRWLKKVGDFVKEDEPVLEIATDKVDSEIPSPVEGTLIEILYKENDLVPVGKVIAIIATDGDVETAATEVQKQIAEEPVKTIKPEEHKKGNIPESSSTKVKDERFYSPLVKSIAKAEGVSVEELVQIKGSGINGRVRKDDLVNYLDSRSVPSDTKRDIAQQVNYTDSITTPKVPVYPGDEVVEMDRVRKLIAEHMVMSKRISPHVTSVVEADVTNIVKWREKVKDKFLAKNKVKLTFMPLITEATAKALRDFPGVNASVDGNSIILRKNVNVGIAVSLDNGNLIVPVVKNADQKNITGLAIDINTLAAAARNNKLTPDDTQGGTFTITNFGSFGNIMGSPIINQPQVAILAVGTIEKKPAVLETPDGDVIAIRHKMYLSLTYDHRVVDGMLGGSFVKRIAAYLEKFDVNSTI
jgi:2-oxoglutarate dehydrogenase E2 component (dihydrolipoamide succinyltransferase)